MSRRERALSEAALLEACQAARRIGETLGARIPDAPPESLWGTVRLGVLGLPVGLDPEQERQVYACFATSHRSSASMRVAYPVEADPHGNKATQVFRAAPPAPTGLVVSQWLDPGPPDEEPVVTPLHAAAALARSLRDWWRPKPDPSAARARTAMVQLALECRRHMQAVEAISLELDKARGRRT